MKTKISMVLMILLLSITFCACSSNNDKVILKDNSKVLARVGEVNITQQNLDKDMTSTLSEKEKLEKCINDQLLLIKAKELNISMSDKEVLKELSEMRKSMSVIIPKNVKSYKLDKNILDSFRNIFIIGKTTKKLGSNLEQELNKLREKIKIQYFRECPKFCV